MEPRAGLDPATSRLVDGHSIRLSYRGDFKSFIIDLMELFFYHAKL